MNTITYCSRLITQIVDRLMTVHTNFHEDSMERDRQCRVRMRQKYFKWWYYTTAGNLTGPGGHLNLL